MIDIQIDNLFVVQNQIERLGRGLGDNRYLLMRRLAGTMHKAVQQNFRQGGRPKWLGLKYRNGKPLTDTGALRDNISQLYDNDTALVGTIWCMPPSTTSAVWRGAAARCGFPPARL